MGIPSFVSPNGSDWMRTPVNSTLSAIDFLVAGDFVITSESESQPTQAARAPKTRPDRIACMTHPGGHGTRRELSKRHVGILREGAEGFKRALRDD